MGADTFSALRAKLLGAPSLPNRLDALIAIGASTGGPDAVLQFLKSLDARNCAIVITQHMEPRFLPSFAQRLNKHTMFEVALAQHDQAIRKGCCYVAPGQQHLRMTSTAGQLQCAISEGQKENGHRPSVDVLFRSVATTCGRRSIAILLTGMGCDGARGLANVRSAGGIALAQDEVSSAVWGMPGSAVKVGAADAVLSLDEMGARVAELLRPSES